MTLPSWTVRKQFMLVSPFQSVRWLVVAQRRAAYHSECSGPVCLRSCPQAEAILTGLIKWAESADARKPRCYPGPGDKHARKNDWAIPELGRRTDDKDRANRRTAAPDLPSHEFEEANIASMDRAKAIHVGLPIPAQCLGWCSLNARQLTIRDVLAQYASVHVLKQKAMLTGFIKWAGGLQTQESHGVIPVLGRASCIPHCRRDSPGGSRQRSSVRRCLVVDTFTLCASMASSTTLFVRPNDGLLQI